MQDLREFHQTNGHCRVPGKYPLNPSLGNWVNTTRREFKKWENGKESSMTAVRVAALNDLGFDWVLTYWEIRLKDLQEFHQTNGHCRVPSKYPPNPSLGNWVTKMRSEFKKRENGKESSLTVERIAALNILGFDWDVDRNRTWKLRLEELREFHQANGHCRVSKRYPQNPPLGYWVNRMRTKWEKKWENGKESSLTAERIAALNNLGFDWVNARKMGE